MNELYQLDPREILQRSASSGHGLSFYKSFYGCRFRTEHEEGRGFDAGVGILLHKLLELRRSNIRYEVVHRGELEIPEWEEACRLYRHYIERYPNDYWTIVGAEQPFSFGWEGPISERTTADVLEMRACLDQFGVPLFTGRLDLVVDIDEEQAQKLVETRNLPLLEPGRYIVDLKTKKSRDANLHEQLLHNFQAILYMRALSLQGAAPKGFIFDYVYRYVDKNMGRGFESFFIPPPNLALCMVAREYLRRAGELREEELKSGAPRKDFSKCFEWGRNCPLIGECWNE